MSSTFRLTSAAGTIRSKPAPITACQLAAFRAFARENGVLTDDLDDEPEDLSYSFEASTCRFAWATIARILGGSDGVIAVIEQAQFLGRRILFYRDRTTASITVRVSDAIDGFEDINLHNANGYAVLDALGLPTDSCGEIDISELRHRLADPKTKRCFINAEIARRFGFFEAAAHDKTPHDFLYPVRSCPVLTSPGRGNFAGGCRKPPPSPFFRTCDAHQRRHASPNRGSNTRRFRHRAAAHANCASGTLPACPNDDTPVTSTPSFAKPAGRLRAAIRNSPGACIHGAIPAPARANRRIV